MTREEKDYRWIRALAVAIGKERVREDKREIVVDRELVARIARKSSFLRGDFKRKAS